jgi:hypothetical protein
MAPVSWLYVRMLHHLDRLAELPAHPRKADVLELALGASRGHADHRAKAGQQRTSPVTGVPGGDNLVVVASIWGSASIRPGTTTCARIRRP